MGVRVLGDEVDGGEDFEASGAKEARQFCILPSFNARLSADSRSG